MIITCPGCATRYEVPETAFNREGRQVRCRACMFKWLAVPDDTAPGIAETESEEPDFDFAGHLAEAERLERNLASMGHMPPPLHDIESAADELSYRKKGPNRPIATGLVAAAASLALIVGAGYEYRENVVRAVPSMAAVYDLAGLNVNVRGMEFANVIVDREFENGLPVLAVRGEIVNVTERMIDVPRVRFGLLDGGAQEIYHWTMAVQTDRLAPAGRAPFVTKLAAPPQEAQDVVVRFHDLKGRRVSNAQY